MHLPLSLLLSRPGRVPSASQPFGRRPDTGIATVVFGLQGPRLWANLFLRQLCGRKLVAEPLHRQRRSTLTRGSGHHSTTTGAARAAAPVLPRAPVSPATYQPSALSLPDHLDPPRRPARRGPVTHSTLYLISRVFALPTPGDVVTPSGGVQYPAPASSDTIIICLPSLFTCRPALSSSARLYMTAYTPSCDGA